MKAALLLVAVAFVATVVLASGPHGHYCGSYNGIVTGKMQVLSDTSANLNIDIFGSDTKCDNETYSYSSTTHVIDFPGATEPTNCLGRLLSTYGITMTATYDPSANSIKLVTSVATITMTACS